MVCGRYEKKINDALIHSVHEKMVEKNLLLFELDIKHYRLYSRVVENYFEEMQEGNREVEQRRRQIDKLINEQTAEEFLKVESEFTDLENQDHHFAPNKLSSPAQSSLFPDSKSKQSIEFFLCK